MGYPIQAAAIPITPELHRVALFLSAFAGSSSSSSRSAAAPKEVIAAGAQAPQKAPRYASLVLKGSYATSSSSPVTRVVSAMGVASLRADVPGLVGAQKITSEKLV